MDGDNGVGEIPKFTVLLVIKHNEKSKTYRGCGQNYQEWIHSYRSSFYKFRTSDNRSGGKEI